MTQGTIRESHYVMMIVGWLFKIFFVIMTIVTIVATIIEEPSCSTLTY